MDFELEHNEIISLYESSATQIEIALFTKRYELNETHFGLLAIQSIAILYSYWEGFIQRSFSLYIDYLNEQNIEFRSFSDSVRIQLMENTFKQFREYPQKSEKKTTFFQKLDSFYDSSQHELTRLVSTEDNVGFKVLNKLLLQFSLEPFPKQWGRYKYPNSSLEELLNTFLRYRNGVAHGGDTSSEEKVTQEVYSKYKILIIDLMYEIHEKIMLGIHNKTYLK